MGKVGEGKCGLGCGGWGGGLYVCADMCVCVCKRWLKLMFLLTIFRGLCESWEAGFLEIHFFSCLRERNENLLYTNYMLGPFYPSVIPMLTLGVGSVLF